MRQRGMKEAKVGQEGNNSRARNAVVTLKDVAVNEKQNKMDVVVERCPGTIRIQKKKTIRDIGHEEDIVEWSNERCER